MASIEKRCRHTRPEWEGCPCTWYLRERVGGRTRYTRLGADRAEAERAAARRQAERDVTVTEAVDAWLDHRRADQHARPNSVVAYQHRAKHVKEWFGDRPLRDVRAADMEAFAHDLLDSGRAPATVRGAYSVLTATLKHAARRGVIREAPAPVDGPGIPAARSREYHLTIPQLKVVVGRMDKRWAPVAELILLTGLRWGEAVAVRPEDIDGDVLVVARTANRAGGVNPPKTRAGRRAVPLSPRAVEILAGLDLPVGGDYRDAHRALTDALGDLHEPGMGWHVLRQAHATLLDQARLSLRDAAARMGHGHHYAQTLQYGLRGEAGDAVVLDAVMRRHDPASGGAGRGGGTRLAAGPPDVVVSP